jgi:hypothetical protein
MGTNQMLCFHRYEHGAFKKDGTKGFDYIYSFLYFQVLQYIKIGKWLCSHHYSTFKR